MDKDLLFAVKRAERRFREGGREVLRLVAERPQGECPAALHFAALVTLFEERAAPLAAAAAAECAALFAAGQGFRFLPHCAAAALTQKRVRGGFEITLHLSLTAGGRVLATHCLKTLWSADGEVQRKPSRARARVQKRRPRLLAEGETD